MKGVKRNGKHRAVLLGLLLLLTCSGCAGRTARPAEESGQQTAEESGQRTTEESGQQTEEAPSLTVAPLLNCEDPDNENLAGMLQRECGGMMVQLEAGQLLGSGVIFGAEEGILRIVTAGHVLAEAEKGVKVTFADGWETQSSDFTVWEQWDLALVYVPLELISSKRLEGYMAANVEKDAYDGLQAGDGCIVMGSRTGVAEEAYEGVVLEPWIYMEDYGQYMMWVQAYGQPGMSGGGVFDRQGRFLGILSGVNEDGEWAAVPLAVLLSQI